MLPKGGRAKVAGTFLAAAAVLASSSQFLVALPPASASTSVHPAEAPESCACHHCPGVDHCCCEHGHAARESSCDPSPGGGWAAQEVAPVFSPVLLLSVLPPPPEAPDEPRPWGAESTRRRFPPQAEQIEKVPIPAL